MTKYVVCKFRNTDSRGYTYACDSALTLNVGDEVKVPDPKHANGWKRVHVSAIGVTKPSFACKEILGKAPAETEDGK